MKMKSLGSILAIATILLSVFVIPCSAAEEAPWDTANTIFLPENVNNLSREHIEKYLGFDYEYGVSKLGSDKIDRHTNVTVQSGYYYIYAAYSIKDSKWSGADKKLIYVRKYSNLNVSITGNENGALLYDGAELKDGTYQMYDDCVHTLYPLPIPGYEAILSGIGMGDVCQKTDATVKVNYVKADSITLNDAVVTRKDLAVSKEEQDKLIIEKLTPESMNLSDYTDIKVYYQSGKTEQGLCAWNALDYTLCQGSTGHTFGKEDAETIKIVYTDKSGAVTVGSGILGMNYLPSKMVLTFCAPPEVYYNSDYKVGAKEMFDIIYDSKQSTPGGLEYSDSLFTVSYFDNDKQEWKVIKDNALLFDLYWHKIVPKNGLNSAATIKLRLRFNGNGQYLPSEEAETMLALILRPKINTQGLSSNFGNGTAWLIGGCAAVVVAAACVLILLKKKGKIGASEKTGKENSDEKN